MTSGNARIGNPSSTGGRKANGAAWVAGAAPASMAAANAATKAPLMTATVRAVQIRAEIGGWRSLSRRLRQ